MTLKNKNIKIAYEQCYALDAEDSIEYLDAAFQVLCDNGIITFEELKKTEELKEKAKKYIDQLKKSGIDTYELY